MSVSLPFSRMTYDPELPIVQRREEIAALIQRNQVVVLCGETGSGKSTQLPKICLELGRGAGAISTGTIVSGKAGTGKMIGHTQPRRIAARSVAARIAEELATPLGQAVGYKVRFSDQTSPATRVKLMTDGILLAESQTDRLLGKYDTIIIDEAHERSLNIDFLLGIVKRILPRRADLKLIITSATIDAARFAEHFRDRQGHPAPVIEVSGRTYPIEVLYRPLDADMSDPRSEVEEPLELDEAVLRAVDECGTLGSGDILVFLPTERDILEVAKKLRSRSFRAKTNILPLYARLPVGEQQKIFAASPHRKIVLATNVAESSLTVPGIRYVIDSGTARISRYSSRSRTQRLPIEPISQASADQRAGRCGRVGPGVCIRLFSEKDYRMRDRYTTPEIQRTNLASVILQTKAFRLGAIERFPFLDPPRGAAITDGYKTLHEIGALDALGELTPLGRRLAMLPVDPRIGRMILAAEQEGCLREMLIIAAALEIQDPRERPQERQQQADAAHAQFADEQSDFLSYLKMWDFYQHLKSTLSRNQLHKACVQNFLSLNRMREWADIHVQLQRDISARAGGVSPRVINDSARANPGACAHTLGPCARDSDSYAALHRSILTGLLSGLAQREDRGEYMVAGGGRFTLWPGSGVFKAKKNFHWILAAERVETGRKYLRTVARIDTNWVEPLAAHLLKRVYLEPHWSRETGYVHAYERVTLYGLTIVPKRRINFGPIDPKQARDLFIQNALVEDEIDTDVDFILRNREMLDEARRLQDKLRRPDLLHGQYARYEFYQTRIPDEVYDRRSLEKWWKTASREQRAPLYLAMRDLCTVPVDAEVLWQYPDSIPTPSGAIRIEYAYKPGEADDGLTVAVPLEGLRQLPSERLGWLVPGLLEAKLVALLRALPKDVRRTLVPIPDTAKSLLPTLSNPDGSIKQPGALEEVLAREVSRLAGHAVKPSDFATADLPPEMRMNIKVLAPDGKTVAQGRELDKLRLELGVEAARTVAATDDPRWNRDMITTWDFGELSASVRLNRAGLAIEAYPMLLLTPDKGVVLRLADAPRKAEIHTRRALVRLFYLKSRKEIATQVQWIPQFEKFHTYASHLPDFDPKRDIGELIAARALDVEVCPLPRSEGGFNRCAEAASKRLGIAVQEVTRLIGPLLEAVFQVRLLFERKTDRFGESLREAQTAADRLLGADFLLTTPWTWLREYPRYFKAILARFEKLRAGGAAADRQGMLALGAYRDRLEEREAVNAAAGRFDPELVTFRWMLEEYRVSLFAQKLGTAIKVSPQRLEKQWEKTERS